MGDIRGLTHPESRRTPTSAGTLHGRPGTLRPETAGTTLLLLALLTIGVASVAAADAPVLHSYRVVNVYPHDREAFTQGLIFEGGALLESTGGFGRSTLRRVELQSGRVLEQRTLASHLFGEGLARAGDALVQLTWRAGRALLYDPESLQRTASFEYPGEGWGLTFDGEHLVMSDGSATLRFFGLPEFAEVRRLEVRDQGVPVERLNELEYVEGKIYANVWFDERIAVISPDSGEVEAWIDLRGILPRAFRRSRGDVLNGIAYDPRTRRLFVTGKRWPRVFEIEVVPAL